MKAKKEKTKINIKWNLKLLYKGYNDPQIEKDIVNIEKDIDDFVTKYDITEKNYLRDENLLLEALNDYEKLNEKNDIDVMSYFSFIQSLDASDKTATAKLELLGNRLTKIGNKMTFFIISIGKIEKDMQKIFLESQRLKHFHFFLKSVFDTAKYHLSIQEEKIMSLKSQTSYDMWVSGNERILNARTVKYKGEMLPIAKALDMVQSLGKSSQRKELSKAITIVLKDVASFSEAEINAIMNNEKVNDELRGYTKPYEGRIVSCENDMGVVEDLRETVTNSFHISKRFYKLKARLLKQKRLGYYDRVAKIGKIKTTFSFENSLKIFRDILAGIDNRFVNILDNYINNGQIDVYPKIGKTGGAYCSGSYKRPTFVLLNHIDDLHSFTTFTHEMGHAFHTELSKKQGILYHSYSLSLAETASTLFETIALDAVLEKLSPKEQIIVLHDKINDDISTIFRQIACFNFELELHNTIRERGYISKEEIVEIHNKNMKAYLGPLFDIGEDDGYFFVHWSHIRNFFYVYTYAYGQLVSKALISKYYKDKSFWKSIEKFLEAGGKARPEEILEEIGIDVRSGEIWKEGLGQIERDIERLERLTK